MMNEYAVLEWIYNMNTLFLSRNHQHYFLFDFNYIVCKIWTYKISNLTTKIQSFTQILMYCVYANVLVYAFLWELKLTCSAQVNISLSIKLISSEFVWNFIRLDQMWLLL